MAKKKNDSVNAVKTSESDDLFAFVCTSTFEALATDLKIDKSEHDTIIDSGTSRHFSPNKEKFMNYRPLTDCKIKMADGRILNAVGMGDVRVDLPNGKSITPIVLKECIHAPDLAFTLLSVS